MQIEPINPKLDDIYTADFFNTIAPMEEPSAADFADIVISSFQPGSLIDIGCGNGIYLKEFVKRDIDCIGIDGSSNAIETALLNPSYILLKDLTQDVDLHQKFDLALCIEVAEHLPAIYSDKLINNLIIHSDTILFTAATPGQTGVDHINEQPHQYWINKFKKRGFILDNALTDLLKKQMSDKKIIFWIVKNLMVFKKGQL